MRCVAALFALVLLAAAATPSAAGPRQHGHGQGHGGPGHGAHGHGGHHGEMIRGPHFPIPRGHRGEGPYMGRGHVRVQPLGRILHGIRGHHPGRHLDVRAVMGPNGEPFYRVKWLTPDGRVLRLYVDAQSGQVMDIEGPRRRPGG